MSTLTEGRSRKHITLHPLASLLLYLMTYLALSGCSQNGATGPPANAQDPRWDPELASQYQSVSPELALEKGCRSCHADIEIINEVMQPYFPGKDGYECITCHEGDPRATTKDAAHAGLYPNPSSMWVLAQGRGCAKCHSEVKPGAGDADASGSILQVRSALTDPSGQTGANHVYRMQRGLMALETGKVNKLLSANGVIEKGQFPFADFDMRDEDGPAPESGTEVYRQWMAQAVEAGLIQPLTEVKGIPDYTAANELWGDPTAAGFVDLYRKQCGRCHLFGEGRAARGDHRAGGCAACHVPYANDALYEGLDELIPHDRAPHPVRHQITRTVPSEQCARCHNREKHTATNYLGMFEYDYLGSDQVPPWDESLHPQQALHGRQYQRIRPDVHGERGMGCSDCHTSIDLHGDGNIYPITSQQVEIGCADCHGTPDAYPWELPVGYGTGVELEGSRGTYQRDRVEYLRTARGNPRLAWVREGDQVYIVSPYSGQRHETPLLKQIRDSGQWKTNQGRTAMVSVSQHLDTMECYACHSTWAPQCYGCHIQYDMREPGTDWVLSATEHDAEGRQTVTRTGGNIRRENRGYLRWENPMLGVNERGKVSPVVPGCQLVWSFTNAEGTVLARNRSQRSPGGASALTFAPLHPHTNTLVARTCESCHAQPKSLGYGVAKSRNAHLLEQDQPFFQDLAEGLRAEIPQSRDGEPQVAPLEGIGHGWDQLISPSGDPLQNTPLPSQRALNAEQLGRTNREGLCAACHQHYDTELWTRVRERMREILNVEGRALTPEEHDAAVEAALQAFVAD